jgi:hypothetical protein
LQRSIGMTMFRAPAAAKAAGQAVVDKRLRAVIV